MKSKESKEGSLPIFKPLQRNGLPAWLFPMMIERSYVKALEDWAQETCTMIAEDVKASIADIVAQRDREIGIERRVDALGGAWGWTVHLSSFMKKSAARAIERVTAAFNSKGIPAVVSETAQAVSKFNRKQWHRILRKQYGVDVTKSEPQLLPRLNEWERRNLALITSIPEQYAAQLEGKILDAVQRGLTAKDVTKLVLSVYPLPLKRARLIARDQVGKLNGQLTRMRQEGLGVTSYRWRGVMDSRERPSHVEHEKKVFDWSDPPADTGHPGEDYQCRCHAEPILPDFEDINWD